jgi:hypothetical protein
VNIKTGIDSQILTLPREAIIQVRDEFKKSADSAREKFDRYARDNNSYSYAMRWVGDDVIQAEANLNRAEGLAQMAEQWEEDKEGGNKATWEQCLEAVIGSWVRSLVGTGYFRLNDRPIEMMENTADKASIGNVLEALSNKVWQVEAEKRHQEAIEAAGGEEAYKAKQVEDRRKSEIESHMANLPHRDLIGILGRLGLKKSGTKMDAVERLRSFLREGNYDGFLAALQAVCGNYATLPFEQYFSFEKVAERMQPKSLRRR